jgi:cytochrome c-type biogenesis protein CcmH/NrfG
LGFVFRAGLDVMRRPESIDATKQVVEPPQIESHAEIASETHKIDNAGSRKAPPESDKSAQNVGANVASGQQAKPAANDKLLRRGRDPVLVLLGQARLNGGLENEAQINSTRAEIEGLPRPLPGDRETARRLNQDGLAMLKKKDVSEAVSKLALAHATDPSDIDIASDLGYAYLLARDLHRADDYLIYAIGLAPSRSSTWLRLGELFAAKQDLELAEAALAHAVRFSDNRTKTRFLLNQLATASPNTILDQAIQNVLNLPFSGFSVTENTTTSSRSDK